MCLVLKKDQKAIVAEEDIVVYKMFEKNNTTGAYRSFYKGVAVEFNKEYTSELIVEKFKGMYIYMYMDIYCINIGLHAFTSIDDVLDSCNYAPLMSGYTGVLVKCIIPKGSTYYENNDQCASDKMFYTDEILKTWSQYPYSEESII